MKKAIGILALALAAGAAQAASISINGGPAIGSSGPVGIGGNGIQDFSGSTANGSWNGIVTWNNLAGANVQTLNLTLTNFTFTATGQANQVLTIAIVQDYNLSPNAFANGTAEHLLDGSVNFSQAGQLATGSVVTNHDAGAAPTVINNGFNLGQGLSSGAGTSPISRNTGSFGVAIASNIWRITTTYTFTLNAAGGTVSLFLPNSGVDNTLVALVPLPPAAFAGLGGLALVGVGAAIRRRNLARA